jgi:hypothetical protein
MELNEDLELLDAEPSVLPKKGLATTLAVVVVVITGGAGVVTG